MSPLAFGVSKDNITRSGGIVTNGLVLHLDGKQYPGSGSTWTDLSGNGNNGSLVNGVGYNSSNLGSLVFDGVNDYGTISSVTPNTGDFTVGFIYQLTGTGGRGGLVERKPSSPFNGFSLGQGGPGSWASSVSGTSNFNNRIDVTFTYPTINTWYFDVIVYSSGTTLTGYRNGVSIGSSTGVSQGNLSTQGTRTNFLIANRDNEISLPCRVAYVSAYNRALTAQEIQQNFNTTRSRFGI
jgi:hypothetical protein